MVIGPRATARRRFGSTVGRRAESDSRPLEVHDSVSGIFWRILSDMSDGTSSERRGSVSTDDLLAGIPITAEGRARARRELDEFDRHWTPERWAALRAKLGVSSKPSAG